VHSSVALVVAVVLAVAVSSQALGALPGVLTIFGDSLSDTGNTNNLTFGLSPGSSYYNGRYSNGPVWDEILSSDLGLAAVTYSRASSSGRDYAYGGAEVGTGSSFSFPFSIPRTGAQISTYLGQHTPAANELFVLWGGANNFLNSASTDPMSVVNSLGSEITSLASAGAKRFLVPNLPRLGETPRFRGTSNETVYNNLSLTFDSDLAAQLNTLAASLNVTIQPLDIQTLFDQALSEPGAFGLSNTTSQAISGVPNPDQYLFWDDVHPTRVMHSILGNVAYDLVAGTVAHGWNANASVGRFGIATNWGPVGLPNSSWQVTVDNNVSSSARTAQVTANQTVTSAIVRGTSGPMNLEVEPGVTLSASGGVTIQAKGTLSGSGTVAGAVTNSGGVLAPGIGTATGTLTINSSYTQASAAKLAMIVGGISSSQHDQLAVSGLTTLGGTLDVALGGGYTPAPTDTIKLATYGSRSGMFDQVIDAAAGWSIHYGATDATAIVNQWISPTELAGDFVVGSNDALVDGNWHWDGLMVKRGTGTLTLDPGAGAMMNGAELAILDGTVRLGGSGALVLSGLTFGDLGSLSGDAALNGEMGWFSAVVPEPGVGAMVGLFILVLAWRRSNPCAFRRSSR
jgi:thermolabile hemolysin